MSKSFEAKERRAKYASDRMQYAKEQISKLGFQFIYETDLELRFLYKCQIIRFYPYTGWATGKTIKDGRGLQNLLKQIQS